jgi:hypothetical protein
MRTAKQSRQAAAARPAARRPPAVAAARSTASASVLHLQRWYGNRAVVGLIRAPDVQRDIGWSEATGVNKGKGTVPGSKMVRIPLAGLPKGNLEPAPNTDKTKELAGGPEGGRAIVWFHTNLKVDQPVQVVVHLHGLTSRGVDPFPGWRETHDDPKASEVEPARQAAKKAGQPFTNPLAGKVRDIERDRIVQQIEALDDPQVMAILPQGTGLGGTAAFGKDFNPDTLVSDVLKRLVAEKLISAAELPAYTIMLSAHSAGGSVVADVLNKKRTANVGGLILFDALWGEPSKDDPKKTVSWQRDALLSWIEAGCKALAPTLKDPSKTADEKQTAINALPGVRGLWEGGYSNTYEDLQTRINRIVRTWIPNAFVPAVSTKFLITKVGTSHDRIVGGTGTTGVEAAPLEHTLKQRGTFVARTPTVQRDTPAAKKVTKVKLTWDGELENKTQLQPVLDKDPADLNADVIENKKVVATADTTATFEVSPTPAAHTFTVKPKAAAPGDYFLPGKAKVTVEADKTTEATVTLPYNRENARFTERTWDVKGIDVAKANNVTSATLFGKSVIGGLNKLAEKRIDATNKWFNDNVKDPAEVKAAQDSIVSIVGRVKRTQSRGTYSNHSTGVAVDINPSNESLQNWHVKKDDKHHAKAMKVFNTVVSQPSLLDQIVTGLARLVYPGAPLLSPFKDFDVWKERDRDRLLEASERFNNFFPDYLQQLAAEADPAASPPPTAESVMKLTKAQLEALAKKATKAKKSDVATTLNEIAAVWFEVRAWVGGYVKTNRKKGGQAEWMLRGEFDKAQAKDKTLKSEGELVGMISLHPAVVKALTEGGWSWLVDYKHDDEKDFMHFEDRVAEKEMKK